MQSKLGRPPFQPTPALRRKVEQCVAAGMSHPKIGLVLGIDRHTVEKHFREELDRGAAIIQAEAMGLLLKSARSGNVSAQKKLYDVAGAAASAAEVTAMGEVPTSVGRVGKKEQAAIDAQTAGDGTPWARYLRDDDPNPPDRPN